VFIQCGLSLTSHIAGENRADRAVCHTCREAWHRLNDLPLDAAKAAYIQVQTPGFPLSVAMRMQENAVMTDNIVTYLNATVWTLQTAW